MKTVNLKQGLLLVLLAVTSITCNAQNKQDKKPNIIYILADDMGLGDVQLYNKDSKIPTPNIDRLGTEGVRFTDAHTSSAVCTPTRYGIITGRYSWRTSTLKKGVLGGHSEHLIDIERETVASILKKQGYKTACVGKWHLGMDWKELNATESLRKKANNVDMNAPIKNGPNTNGFDYYFGISASLNMNPHVFIENDKALGTFEYLKNEDALEKRGYIGAKPGWSAKEFEQDEVLSTFTKKTCDWIEENKDTPFFVYMPLNAPHSPIVPSKKFIGKSGLNDHGDFCMETDWAVGQVMETLDRLNIADNTIIIFTADNGTSPKAGFPAMAERGHHSSWIYRGMKGTNWEGGHRVPFLVRWPNKVKKEQVSDQLICTTDLMATCASLLGITLNENEGEDSISFLPALHGETIPEVSERTIAHHSDGGIFSIRTAKWKLMFDDFGGSNRTDPRKNEPIKNAASLQLFDMENDATEDVNLASQYPEIVEELKKNLATIIKEGRSNPGKNQPTDLNTSNLKWPQIKVVEEYLYQK
ncbi:sulfatase family protein [Zobellia uliginosa]|uniref:sulfatase family protein n=1 Tax=Zobellia uliginosa TaxID=143224 RepID=UPI001C07E73D|nr:arylsulfatase [Zobellia uliginosa]MBU2947152.1 arylsulfatase [Zobellia uliginosa]